MKDWVGFAIYRLLAFVLGALPLELGFRLGRALGTLGYFVAGPYRRLVLSNLAIAFGREKSAAELGALGRSHFATLGANLFASLKLPRLSREELLSRVVVEGMETLDPRLVANGGFVLVIGHLGNWELLAQLMPMLFKCHGGTIFQALGNRLIDAELRRDRARQGLQLFERKEGFVKACQCMQEGGAVGVLVDQHAGDGGLWCPFFGRLASTSTLAATLARRTSGWLVPAAVYTIGVARWRCVVFGQIKPENDDVDATTVRINAILAEQIRRQPEDWFWVHNRWKTPKPKFLLQKYKRGVRLASDASALQPFRILIRASNWLGDAIISLPAVQAIKRGRPDAHVTILTPAKLADVWRRVPEVDDVITIEPRDSVFAVAKKLRPDFDAAILFPNSLRVALEAWLAGIPRRVGYAGHRRRALLDQVFEPQRKKAKATRPRHQVHHYLALAEFVGADVRNATQPAAARSARDESRRPILGLCPGAEYGPAKRWLPERFAEVVRFVHERTGCEWKIFGVEKDRPIASEILTLAATPCTDLVGKTTLAQLIAELRTCDLLLTNDTGTMHLAAHLGVPTVALFGSTEPALTGPLGAHHQVIRHHVECSPCFLRECPIDFRCMKVIEVSEVIAALETMLRRGSAAAPNNTVDQPATPV